MIIYFANRKMEILGQASTNLPKGIVIKEDDKVEEIDVGVATFECRITYSDETRATAEQWTEAGNYILRSNGDEKEFYTIINTEIDTKEQDIYIYAEDAGMDLLNEILKASDENATEQTCTEYVETAIYDSGFQIGINESDDSVKKLLKFDEQTASERILDIMKEFELEVSYSFDIDRLTVTNKYINIHKKRGKDIGVQLRDGRELDGITIKKTVENLATALLCTGSEDASGVKISLQDYEYDDGDFYVEGHYLKSRNALAKWSRYVNPNEPNTIDNVGHIVQTFTYDTVDQKELCEQAIKELKKKCDIERNYEIEITHLPEGIKIGDIVNVVDDSGELYLQSRLLKLETSVVDNTQTATLGEYLIKDSGVSQKVDDLAEKFSQLANGRKDIIKIEDEYYLSTSDETQSGGEWSNISDYEYGKYIWERSKITWTDGNTTHTDAHISGALNKANENAAESKDTANEAKETADNTLNDFSKFKVGEFDSLKSKQANFETATAQNFSAVNGSIANLSGDFADYKKVVAKDIEATNARIVNIESDYIKTSELEAKVGMFGYLKADTAEITYAAIKDLDVINAKIGSLEAGQIKTEYLDANYAKIDLANIKDGSIKTAMIGSGVVGTAQIADGSITDAKIVGLTANKITAGTLDAGTIEVINLNAANITVGTINGQQIAPGAVNMSNLADSVTVEINTANTNANQAIQDALDAINKATSATNVANAAQTTANGKNTVFYQTTEPSAIGRKINDIWFVTDDGNKMYYWNGSVWTVRQFGTNAIANAAITNALIADATIENSKIKNLDAAKITTGSLDSERIAANTITANKIAIGDFTNYSDLTVDTAEIYGFSVVEDSSASGNPWFQLKTLQRDTSISPRPYINYPCNGGETFRIKFQVSSTVQGTSTKDSSGTKNYLDVNVGLYAKKDTGNSTWIIPSCGVGDANGTVRTVSVTVTLPSNARSFNVQLQLDGYNFTGVCKVRNIQVTKMSSGELIVDGAITANKLSSNSVVTGKIATNAVTAGTIVSGAISTDKLSANAVTTEKIASRTITADKIVAGAITSNEIAAKTITANNIASNTITADKIDVLNLFAQDIIGAGSIRSNNYAESNGVATVGSKWILNDGSFKSKNLSWDANGNLKATGGIIGGWSLSNYSIYTKYDADQDIYGAGISGTKGKYVLWAGETNNAIGSNRSSANPTDASLVIYNNGGLEVRNSRMGADKQNHLFTAILQSGQIGFKIDDDYIGAITATDTISDSNNVIMRHASFIARKGYGWSILHTDDSGNLISDIQRDYGTNNIRIRNGVDVTVSDTSKYNAIETIGNVVVNGKLQTSDIITTSANLYANDLIASGNIVSYGDISGYRFVSADSNSNYIDFGNYNDALNNYYSAEGYHAFYCGGTGIAYVNSEGISMGDYDIKFNLGHGIKYGSSEWILRPYTSGDYNVTALGNGNRRTVLYGSQVRLSSATGTVVSSDRRLKKDFADFDERYDKFYMNLKPQMYRMAYTKNAEEYKITNGFIAQDVEDALCNADINPMELDLISCETADKDFLNEMFEGNPPDIEKQYSLNYSGFIALNTYMIQKTRKEMLYQAGKIDLHETIIQDLQNRIYQLEKQIKELRQAVA